MKIGAHFTCVKGKCVETSTCRNHWECRRQHGKNFRCIKRICRKVKKIFRGFFGGFQNYHFFFRLPLVAKAKIPIAMKGFSATTIGVSRWKNVNKLQTVLRITHAMSGQEIVSEVPNKRFQLSLATHTSSKIRSDLKEKRNKNLRTVTGPLQWLVDQVDGFRFDGKLCRTSHLLHLWKIAQVNL